MKVFPLVALSLSLATACREETKTKTVTVEDPKKDERIAELELKNQENQAQEEQIQARIAAAITEAVAAALKDAPTEAQIQERIQAAVETALAGTITSADAEEKIKAAIAEAVKNAQQEYTKSRQAKAAQAFADLIKKRNGMGYGPGSTLSTISYTAVVDPLQPCNVQLTEQAVGKSDSYTYFLNVTGRYISEIQYTEEGSIEMVGINLAVQGYRSEIRFESKIGGQTGSGVGQGPFLSFRKTEIAAVEEIGRTFGFLIHECSN